MVEPRAPVMILVEASWEDRKGNRHAVPARMEDRSDGGACVRLKAQIPVGSRLGIEWRWEKFTGVARYCRPEGNEYVVGLQRDVPKAPPKEVPWRESIAGGSVIVSTAKISPQNVLPARVPTPTVSAPAVPDPAISTPRVFAPPVPDTVPAAQALAAQVARRQQPLASSLGKIPVWKRRIEDPPNLREASSSGSPALPLGKAGSISTAISAAEIPRRQQPLGSSLGDSPVSKRRIEASLVVREASLPAISAPPVRKAETPRPAALPGAPPRQPAVAAPRPKPVPPAENAGKERNKPMSRKWLEMAPWNSKPDVPNPNGDADSGPNASQENRMPAITSERSARTAAMPDEKDDASFQTELVPMEDIYRVAGITLPRKGYSIKKVIEMLDSQHIRDLSKEMKRVAVLMALDAAGVPIDEVLKDAQARRQALDSYEAEVKKRAEAEWARKEEENIQIEAELERLKAQHTARIARNLEVIAREKATFDNWITQKQQESQSIADATELCLKAAASEESAAPSAAPAKAFAKTAQ
jgi:hypothetical protein